MTEAAIERPSVRLSFRWVAAIALGLALVALLAGRRIYQSYGGYKPMALAHVPSAMRYRARVELGDAARAPLVQPVLAAMDPRGVRRPALEQKLGISAGQGVKELAFGAGPAPTDFVVVFGLQLPGEAGPRAAAKSVCEVLASDGIRSQPTDTGCRLEDGAIVAQALDGMLVLASREELVKGLLGRPEIGDRLGFSGPSVRGVAPDVAELGREAQQLAQLLGVKYP